MKDDLRYTPTTCFEPFPFPLKYESNVKLEKISNEYLSHRSNLMINNNEGLTDTYNRFHNINEDREDIVKPVGSSFHKMDKLVVEAYGWGDLELEYEFRLDYEDEEESASSKKKMKPYELRLTQELEETILAHLIELNVERFKQEQINS